MIAIETGLALRLVFHQPLRQTENLLRSVVDVLGLAPPQLSAFSSTCRMPIRTQVSPTPITSVTSHLFQAVFPLGGATAAVLKDRTTLDVTLVPVSIEGTPPPNLSLVIGSITVTGSQ